MEGELFLLPYAGGSSLSYSRWHFGEGIKTISLDYRGHGVRFKETLDFSFDELVSDVTNTILSRTDGLNVNIFGHSMGGLVAWDVTNNLLREGIVCQNLIVSACLPPHLFEVKAYNSLATEEGLMKYIKSENRLTENQIKSRMFRDVIYHASINDYRLLSLYKRNTWDKVPVNITVMYGNRDSLINVHALEMWKEYSSVGFMRIEFLGDHYYIENEQNLLQIEKLIRDLIVKDKI